MTILKFLNLLYTATELKKPFAIRYPKGTAPNFDIKSQPTLLPLGSWEYIWKYEASDLTILAVGSMVDMILEGKEELEKEINFSVNLINCRFIKPLDMDKIRALNDNKNDIITIEEGSLIGGFASTINDCFSNRTNKIISMGIPDNYIEHGSRQELLDQVGLNIKGVISSIRKICSE